MKNMDQIIKQIRKKDLYNIVSSYIEKIRNLMLANWLINSMKIINIQIDDTTLKQCIDEKLNELLESEVYKTCCLEDNTHAINFYIELLYQIDDFKSSSSKMNFIQLCSEYMDLISNENIITTSDLNRYMCNMHMLNYVNEKYFHHQHITEKYEIMMNNMLTIKLEENDNDYMIQIYFYVHIITNYSKINLDDLSKRQYNWLLLFSKNQYTHIINAAKFFKSKLYIRNVPKQQKLFIYHLLCLLHFVIFQFFVITFLFSLYFWVIYFYHVSLMVIYFYLISYVLVLI